MFRHQVDSELELQLVSGPDAEALLALVDRSRESLRPWLDWVNDVTRDRYRAEILEGLARFGQGLGFYAGIRVHSEWAGAVDLTIDVSGQHGRLGYWLATHFEGRGIMTRVGQAVVGLAFLDYGVHRLSLQVVAQNVKSQALARRLGFQLEGVTRQAEWIDGTYYDVECYGLLAEDWKRADGRSR
jgi:ribosomal-protein-serine acetyltransferase